MRAVATTNDYADDLRVALELADRADALHRRALENLIATSREDWFEFMRWKEIYEKMEDATDLCEDIADVLQTIVLKHG